MPPRPGQPGPGFAPGQPPRRRRRRAPLIIGAAVVALALIAIPVAVHLVRAADAQQGYQRTTPPLRPGEPITRAKLDQVSPQDFLWDQLQRQMMQPISEVDDAPFVDKKSYTAHDDYYVHQTVIDHTSGRSAKDGRFSSAETSYQKGDKPSVSRCIGAKYYFLSTPYGKSHPSWRYVPGNNDACELKHQWTATDGIVPSGLNQAQSAQELSTLREKYKGFANAGKPTLIKASGQTYIRQIVDYQPLKLADGAYEGSQIFIWAFQSTGLDWEAWPFINEAAGGAGQHIVYYIDPKTLLPVASKIQDTPALDDTGHPERTDLSYHVINYRFPTRFHPLTLKSEQPVKLDLPQGWAIPK